MKKKFLSLLTITALCASLMACGSKSTDATSSTAASNNTASSDLEDFTVVLDWYPNAVHAFIYDAIAKGYYAEEGLNVKIEFPSNSNDAMSLTAAGKADIGIYYMQDVIMARANQNVPVVCAGTVAQKPLNIILSLKDKNIASPKDLAGKTIGYAGTELSEALVKAMMENAGVNYSDVTMVDVGFDLMSSMTTGNVDATIGCMVNHEVPQMEKEGFEVSHFSPTEYGVPDYYELLFITSEDTANNNSDALDGFLRASQKGFDDMKADPAGTLDTLLANQNEENFPLDKDVETKSMEVLMPSMEPAGSEFLAQDVSVWQSNIDWLYEQGLISTKIDANDLIYTPASK